MELVLIPNLFKLTQALHTDRINLSPFTKDFRVWGASIETISIYLRVSLQRNSLILIVSLHFGVLAYVSDTLPKRQSINNVPGLRRRRAQ